MGWGWTAGQLGGGLDGQTEWWKERWVEADERMKTGMRRGPAGRGLPGLGEAGWVTEPKGGHSLRPVSQEGVCRSTLLGPPLRATGWWTRGVRGRLHQDPVPLPHLPVCHLRRVPASAHAGGSRRTGGPHDLCRECPGGGPGHGAWPLAEDPRQAEPLGAHGERGRRAGGGAKAWASRRQRGGRGTLSRAPPEPRWGLEAVPRSWAPCSLPLRLTQKSS